MTSNDLCFIDSYLFTVQTNSKKMQITFMASLCMLVQCHLKRLAKSSGKASEEIFRLAVESGRCIHVLQEEFVALTKSKQSQKKNFEECIKPAEDAIKAERY